MSQKKQRTKHLCFDYTLAVRVINGRLVVTVPGLDLPIPVVRSFNPPSIAEGGKALINAWTQVQDYLDSVSGSHPTPLSPKQGIPELPKEIGIKEAAKMTGLNEMMVRRLADSGAIKFRTTPGKHRRFMRTEIGRYIREIRDANR
jgi:excisionase family DNA binding protein